MQAKQFPLVVAQAKFRNTTFITVCRTAGTAPHSGFDGTDKWPGGCVFLDFDLDLSYLYTRSCLRTVDILLDKPI